MDEARRNQIAYYLLRDQVRKHFSIINLNRAKREIGNLAKKPGMIEIGATAEEILEFGQIVTSEVFDQAIGR